MQWYGVASEQLKDLYFTSEIHSLQRGDLSYKTYLNFLLFGKLIVPQYALLTTLLNMGEFQNVSYKTTIHCHAFLNTTVQSLTMYHVPKFIGKVIEAQTKANCASRFVMLYFINTYIINSWQQRPTSDGEERSVQKVNQESRHKK